MKKLTIPFAILIFGISSGELLSQTDLTKYVGNPVLTATESWENGSAAYASVIYDEDESIYKMWYTGYRSVGYATSLDGLNWSKYSGNPILTNGLPGDWDSGALEKASVIKKDGEYLMWYVGGQSTSALRIGFATSNDGINWNKYIENPVLTNGPSGKWDSVTIRKPTVIYHENIFHMWYGGEDGRVDRIGYATSVDGKNWIKQNSGNDVVELSPNTASGPGVVFDGSQYVMFHFSNFWGREAQIGVTFSSDGIIWLPKPSILVLEQEGPTDWDRDHVDSPSVMIHENKYKVWFSAGSGNAPIAAIGYAEGPIPNLPPFASAGLESTYECNSPSGSLVALDGSGSDDPDGDPLTYTWLENGNIIAGPTTEAVSQVTLDLGSHTIELTVNDGNGGTVADTVVINVEDTTPPTLTVSVSPDQLWPPNHKMRDITAMVTVNDVCDANAGFVLLLITSNEPEEGPGKKHSPDIMGADFGTSDTNFQLRAERFGGGIGRIYTITYEATDASSNSATAAATVTVPHDMAKDFANSEAEPTPDSYALLQNYPNPFNPETEIRFQLPDANHLELKIFDILGREIRTLAVGLFETGFHSVSWDALDDSGNPVASGIYLYQIQAGTFRQVMKMSLMR